MKVVSNSDTISFITELISKSTGELRQLYQRYGIDQPINPETLVDAVSKYGESFRMELFSIAQKIQAKIPNSFTMVSVTGVDEFSSLNEESITSDLWGNNSVNEAPAEVKEEKKSINWDTFNGIFSNAVGLFGQINTAAGKGAPATPNQTTTVQPQPTATGSKSKTIIIIAAVVVVLIIVAFVVKKSKK